MLIVSLWGCEPAPESSPAFVAPLAGQTAVPIDLPLLVAGVGAEVPPDYPLGESIRVVDLTDGGFVAGSTAIDGDDLLFEPNEPWLADRRYAWTFDPTDPAAHGPELPVPMHVAGSAVFATADSTEVLGAAVDGERLCLVLSRSGVELDASDLLVTVDDVEAAPADLELLPREAWDPALPRLSGDPYVDVWCARTEPAVAPGAIVRVSIAALGPWRFDIGADGVSDLVLALHRGAS